MSKRPTKQAYPRRSSQTRGWLWAGLAGAALIVIVVSLIWWRNNSTAGEAGANMALPTPIGFPDTAQDVGTKVGQPAPAFTLPDDTGQMVSVTPGQTGRPTVLIFNMGVGWQLCVQQLGELQDSVKALQAQANVYTLNRDPAAQVAEMRQRSGSTLPILSDANLAVAGQYDFLPKPGQPMGGMSGVAQMGFVIIDAQGIIRAQRVDLYFGDHAGQMLEILEALGEE